MATINQENQRKVVIIGDGGVGKTTFLKQLRTGNFDKKYLSTIGVECHPLYAKTIEQQNVAINFWDCAGQEKFSGLSDGYYIGASAAIVMFSLLLKNSFRNLDNWILKFRRMCPEQPILIVATQSDMARPDLLRLARKQGYPIISTKDDPQANLEMIRLLCNSMGLQIDTQTITSSLLNITEKDDQRSLPLDMEEDEEFDVEEYLQESSDFDQEDVKDEEEFDVKKEQEELDVKEYLGEITEVDCPELDEEDYNLIAQITDVSQQSMSDVSRNVFDISELDPKSSLFLPIRSKL